MIQFDFALIERRFGRGAGSPQAQRIQIGRQMELEFKKGLAKRLAGIESDD